MVRRRARLVHRSLFAAAALLTLLLTLSPSSEGGPTVTTMSAAPSVDYSPAYAVAAQAQRDFQAAQFLKAARVEAARVEAARAAAVRAARARQPQARAAQAAPGPVAVDSGGWTAPDGCMVQMAPKARKSVAEAHHCWDGLLARYPWSQGVAFQKLYCESGGNPFAANESGARGLMQILSRDSAGRPVGSFDPATNMSQAWDKYRAARGWSPWVC